MAEVGNGNVNIPTTYNTNGDTGTWWSNSALAPLLDPGAVARDNWEREERHAENAWMREMYADSTKIQRTMADASAAGINPVYAIAGTSGASGASGGSSSGSTSDSSAAAGMAGMIKLGADIALAIITKGKSVGSIGFGK